jgi:hypothetical protein
MSWLDWLIVILAVMYSAEVVAHSHGPYHVFDKVRARVALGGLMECPWCLAIWFGIVFLALYSKLPVLVWPFAASGAAMALRSYTGARLDV